MAGNDRWLIAGLGNPGPWFRLTRHNAGFLVVDHLAARHGVKFRRRGLACRVAELELDGRPVLLVKPRRFINSSGGPVRQMMHEYGVPAKRLLVVQDDLDFPFGTVRIKRAGGPGGHNGMRSVFDAIGTRDCLRLRFGLGRPPKGQTIGTFVLRNFSPAEQAALPDLLDRCADSAELLLSGGLGRAQNALHGIDPSPIADAGPATDALPVTDAFTATDA